MQSRAYDPDRDLPAVLRVLREVGWLTGDDANRRANELWLGAGESLVAEVGGETECLVACFDGSLRHLDADLPLTCVGAVVSGRVARGGGLATALTAEAVAAAAHRGAAVVVLGVFDQGFYDRLGFGTGSYERRIALDPADLLVEAPRPPVRLGEDDFERMHASRLAGKRGHGACRLTRPEWTQAETLSEPNGFGLGYLDQDGGLLHHLWASTRDPERGPYRVEWLAWRSAAELRELLALLRTLGDQVHSVRLREPPGVQLQDLLRRPARRADVGKGGRHSTGIQSVWSWQVRICALEACLAETALPVREPLTFHLELTDPLPYRLPAGSPHAWDGVAGEWTVTLGEQSSAERGARRRGLRTLRASVGTFSRLWLGVRPASGLACTCPDLEAPADLLADLDRVLRLPEPAPDWDV